MISGNLMETTPRGLHFQELAEAGTSIASNAVLFNPKTGGSDFVEYLQSI